MAPDRGPALPKASSRAWDAFTPPLSQWILDATAAMNFSKMTPVQASTIPLFMAHKDVVVEAVTGSGKTLAFLIPLVERILRQEEAPKKHHVGAIVISPTRELATQIHNVLLSLLAFHPPSASALRALKRSLADAEDEEEADEEEPGEVFPANTPKLLPQLLLGGSNAAAQDLSRFLKTSPNVLIGTPGRLLEILSSPYVHAPQSSFDLLVLDEADRLLDLGFKDDLTKILALLPKQRRTGLFSASVSEAVDQIIRVGLRNPVRIAVKVKGTNGVQDKKTPASLKMTYLLTPASQKLLALKNLLQKVEPRPLRTIVYLSTCAAVDYFQHLLPSILPTDMLLVPLHGKHPSNVRQKNFTKFVNSASPAVLLTTDVAARGLDVPSVDLVVQVDPPSDPKVFIHRCGRAGRAGRKGLSVVFLQLGCEEEYISFLEVRKTPIEKLESLQIDIDSKHAAALTSQFREAVLEDRALYDKAQKAFVSWVRSYSKHQASSIFRVSDLDWNDLVQGWALLRFPKMPEAKKYDRKQIEVPKVDWDSFAYKDKQREKQRKEALTSNDREERKEKPHTDKKRDTTTAWSEKLEQKANREVKRTKREAKRDFERTTKMTDAERARRAETQQMIEQIRQQQLQAAGKDDEFEGFD
ncbi:ATP-dependent rRNA helicase spb4 [Exophiala xenobiotica]|uniref:ATP-dependent RNA helicase n=1 Tax=Lithohypha guttulata TaxID=1690604 RepID=A0ABR0K368_9EURO|nr:ATP-dependent rRNA helicase spb4 [Lithohypha guttulata]KAK5312967.1 ATP-dependent rRNA helicase spb4 [Exophiala xenobiotica]